MVAKLLAEFLGTFWLVLGGCGSAVLAATFGNVGIGLTGVSLAFGLTVLTGAYALGPVSGGHFNPAVSHRPLGRRTRFRRVASCPTSSRRSQARSVAAGVLYVIATGKAGADIGGFATNGYGEHSPGGIRSPPRSSPRS